MKLNTRIGSRSKGMMKEKSDISPLISIVTVVFNGEKELEGTIQSVICQNYPNVEYIVIDGGSKDGTLNIIKKYKKNIDYWISEKDEGIYDAMNKGIANATGDWIIFMNAGDLFYNKQVLKEVFNTEFEQDVIYGNHVYAHLQSQIIKPRDLKFFWKGLPFNHQACFVRTKLLKKYNFDLRYKISSVHDLFYKLNTIGYQFKYVNKVISIYDLTGVSATSYKWLVDNWNINFKYSITKMHLVIGALTLHFLSKIKRSILRRF